MKKYVDNAQLECLIESYKANLNTLDDPEKKKIHDELFLIFFEMAKKLAFVVFKKTKFYLDKYMLDDLISVGTAKAVETIHKFNRDGNNKNAKAFNFFTTVIKNEMIQELMKDQRKNWFKDPDKVKSYVNKLQQHFNVKEIK